MSKLGFVTFTNLAYFELNEVLIKSILDFTTYSVEVMCVDCDRPSTDRIKVNKMPKFDCNIFFCKTWASIISEFDIGVQLDADMIVTPESVELFNRIEPDFQRVKGALHPNDPEPNTIVKSQPYVHATYLFTKYSKQFLQCVYNMRYEKDNDERAINHYIWDSGFTDCWTKCYDPYVDFFLDHSRTKEAYPFDIDYFICHGCKITQQAEEIYKTIKDRI